MTPRPSLSLLTPVHDVDQVYDHEDIACRELALTLDLPPLHAGSYRAFIYVLDNFPRIFSEEEWAWEVGCRRGWREGGRQ